jgi:SAM-dependent methyltransferase
MNYKTDNLSFDKIFTDLLVHEGVNSISLPFRHSANKIIILEIGAGFGNRFNFYTRLLKEHNHVCVDINLQELKKGKQLNPNLLFVCADIDNLPFKNSSFDLLLSYSVLHYVDWKSLIKNISEILRNDGEIVMIENLAEHPLVFLYRLFFKMSGKKYSPYMNPKKYMRSKDLNLFEKYFKSTFKFYHLFTPLALIKPILSNRSGEQWKLKSDVVFNKLLKVDNFLLKIQPLKRFGWFVCIHGKKYNS